MEEAFYTVRVKYAALLATIPQLKEEQQLVIQSVLGGQDTFANLPTSFGKSLTYVLSPLIADELEKDVKHLSLVVSPLLSIISEQVRKLQAAGIKAHAITSESEPAVVKEVQAGNTQVVFITPECAALKSWRETFRSLMHRITVLCIDECHCITTWGRSFRRDYRKLGELCSYITCPVLFLTGTATKVIKNDVLGLFGIFNCVTISRTPDRENLRIFVKYTTHKLTRLQWLLDYYMEHGVHSKKVVVFTTSIQETTRIYWWMLDELDKVGKAYTGDVKCVDDRIIDMYHAHVSPDCEERIRNEFPKSETTIRLLISTIKMGMGVDIADIDAVVLFGAPGDIIDLWQELGRSARGHGRKGLAVVYLTGLSMSGCKDPRLIALRDEDQCYRKTILDSFKIDGVTDQDLDKGTTCSGECDKVCHCTSCRCCNHCSRSCTCVSAGVDLKVILESL